MIIECSYCKAKVSTRVIAQHESHDPEEPGPFITSLLECPSCKNALISGQFEWFSGGEYSREDPYRVWPQPKKYLSWSIPDGIRTSIEESQKCISGSAFIASAAMSGRALEGVCRHFSTKSKYLGKGLEELKDRGVIDNRLLEWGRELQKHRNIAAHAGDQKIHPQDAVDLLDFVTAICEYVFVLTEKFEQFMARSSA